MQVSSIMTRSGRTNSADEDSDQNIDVGRGESGRQKLLFDPKTGKYAASEKVIQGANVKKSDHAGVKPPGGKKGPPDTSVQNGTTPMPTPSVLSRSSQDRQAVTLAAQAEQRDRVAAEAQRMRELRAAERAARGPRTKGVLFIYNESDVFEQVLTEPEKLEQEQKRREKFAAKELKESQKRKPFPAPQQGRGFASSFTKNSEPDRILGGSDPHVFSGMMNSAPGPVKAELKQSVQPPKPIPSPPLIPAWSTREITLSALDMTPADEEMHSVQPLLQSMMKPLVQPMIQPMLQPTMQQMMQQVMLQSDEFDILREAVPQLETGIVVGNTALLGQARTGELDLGLRLELGYSTSTMTPLSPEFVPGVGWGHENHQDCGADPLEQDQWYDRTLNAINISLYISFTIFPYYLYQGNRV